MAIVQVHNISEINKFVKGVSKHPLVAVIDFSKVDEYIQEDTRISCDFYSVMFKNYCANTMRYGRQSYDFQEGSLICIAPKQVLTMDSSPGADWQPITGNTRPYGKTGVHH